jgi:D-sedoheptulose 7-phosphate isomerase
MHNVVAQRVELGIPTVKTTEAGHRDPLQPDLVRSYLDELRSLLDALDGEHIWGVVGALFSVYQRGRRIFLVGNGGSAATASHFACDLAKNVSAAADRRFKVIALTDNVPLLTAWANDISYERVFAEQLESLVEAGDAVIAISGSGNSPNVLRAMELARARGATTIGLTGFEGGRLKPLCDVCVVVPSIRMDQIEDTHQALQHLVCHVLRAMLAAELANGHQPELSRSRVL